jgi:tetratricopeptide (TPR) repeat protein
LSADSSPKAGRPGRTRRTPPRIWLYRALAAIGIPALILAGLEGGLRVAGFGQTVRFMIPDEKPGYLRTNPNFVSSFMPSSFDLRPLNFRVPARKPPNTVRIVVLGESAAQGIPVPSFGFAAQLRAQLRARYPGKDFEVINTGIVAINSHVVYQISREMASLSPDLFVVYMGNNEVVGPYGPGCAYLSKMPPLWVIRLSVFVRSTRMGQLAAAAVARLGPRGRTPAEWGGMAMFADSAVAGDDPRLQVVYRNFEANLRDIVGVARSAGAGTILCTVVSNLKDCAPLLSLHGAGLAAADLSAWGPAFERGRIEWLMGKDGPARADLAEALRLDPHYADTAFMLGSMELAAGDTEAARTHFFEAEHWDALRFRPDPRINEIIRTVARDSSGNVHLLDAALQMGSDPASSGPPAGREILFEHVHFDWDGNYQLARSMAAASEEALFGPGKSTLPWLDSKASASALGYTAHERLAVLEKVATIVQNPPFTNQLTYCEDEARLDRELALARTEKADPSNWALALGIDRAAIAADPENADLVKLGEGLADDNGDVAVALAEARRAKELEPASYALSADEAIKLSRLGRFEEAERILVATANSCDARDRAAMAPAFADLYTRTRRFEDGIRFMEGEISRRPNDESLRIILSRLHRLAGNTAAAEADLRTVLAENPGSQPALESLVRMLVESGRSEAAETESLSALDHQPRNLANNLRSSIIYETRHDEARSVQCLNAAERSGHVNAAVELRLAQKLFRLQRYDEALAHLAQARRISLYERDSAATDSIGRAADQLWTQLH